MGNLNFYPRSPCGERLINSRFLFRLLIISIHALLAESDQSSAKSTPEEAYFYPRSPCGERQRANSLPNAPPQISIHALLAESDIIKISFLSRLLKISIHALLAESDYSTQKKNQPGKSFLSTLSLRRATPQAIYPSSTPPISIHALLAESDEATF